MLIGLTTHFSTSNLSPRETSHGPENLISLTINSDYIPTTPYKLLCADKVIIIFSIQSDPLLLMRA
jgi:hypothetical protein